LSLDLDKAQTLRERNGPSVRLPNAGKSKTEALAEAGISTSAALSDLRAD